MRDQQGFTDFATARAGDLRRQAYLLTGSPDRAVRLADKALAETGRRWDRLGGVVAAEEHARRVVATGSLRGRGVTPAVALTTKARTVEVGADEGTSSKEYCGVAVTSTYGANHEVDPPAASAVAGSTRNPKNHPPVMAAAAMTTTSATRNQERWRPLLGAGGAASTGPSGATSAGGPSTVC